MKGKCPFFYDIKGDAAKKQLQQFFRGLACVAAALRAAFIERATLLSVTKEIGVESILFSFETVSSLETMKSSAKEFIKDLSLLDLVSRYEKDIITEALKKSTSIRKAAKKLKICHTTLLNKMKKLKIHPKS